MNHQDLVLAVKTAFCVDGEKAPLYRWRPQRRQGNSYCGSFVVYHGKKGEFWRSRCRGRACGHLPCRMAYAKALINRLKDIVDDNHFVAFFTLTLDSLKFKDVEEEWQEISHVWSKMRKRIDREVADFRYVAVLEKHKDSDKPHIHGLSNSWIDHTWLCQAWQACGGGVMTNIKGVYDEAKAMDYMVKGLDISTYFGKSNLDVGDYVAPRKRIFWKSQGLNLRKKVASKAIGFVRNKRVWCGAGKMLLTTEGVSSMINEDIGTYHKGDDYYEARQKWSYVEAALFKVPERSLKDGKQNLASDSGRQEDDVEGERFEKSKTKDKRGDKKTLRQMTFEDWRTYGESS